MPLPSSGPLSLNDIQTEFGGTNPISISEYYAGGAFVPAGTSGTNGPVPSSGAISISNFYGTTAFIPFGEAAYTTEGTYSYVVPAGITQICAVAVGGGGANTTQDTGGAGGGALSYTNNIAVTPGETLTVVVGKAGAKPLNAIGNAAQITGGLSSIARGSTILLRAAPSPGIAVGQQGTPGLAAQGVGAVRYSGGFGKTSGNLSAGGGASGYSGNGGNGGDGTILAQAGSGGGGGGGGRGQATRSNSGAGGVGIQGQGANGAGGQNVGQGSPSTDGTGGGGGSGGQSGGNAGGLLDANYGGAFGGGAGAENDNGNVAGQAGRGAVRIIWGTGKSYPFNAT